MNALTARVLGWLGRVNDAHPWSHNDRHIPWILREAHAIGRRGGTRALDVGCGTGNLVARLAVELPDVVGLEPDAETAALARSRLAATGNAQVVEGSFADRPDGTWDLVTFVAVLHHLPLAETLATARSLLRPGGRLVVVGVSREAPGDALLSVVSMALNPVVGLVRHPRRAQGRPASMTAPTADAAETFDEIADVMRRELPGVRIRRGLFWRYRARWVAPAG
ncbi:class I SAM-dependent methyltransferase [Microbacterium sp.]|uniref:class I SAM-dependent methyltransferase n=1 Tax=Microbacterium sp. TaxID=51671 RepID=UPI00334092FE